METPSSLRGRTQWTQRRLAAQLGIRQADVSDIELGKRDIGEHLAAKWAHLINVSGDLLLTAAKNVQRVNTAVTDSEAWSRVAVKSGSLDGAEKVTEHMMRLATDFKVPEALRQRAVKVAENLANKSPERSATKADSVTMTLAEGVTGEFTIRPGSELDPDLDATGFQVALNGEGIAYIADPQTGEAFGPIFGSMVQQQGTPAGSKATKSADEPGFGRDAWGRSTRNRQANKRRN